MKKQFEINFGSKQLGKLPANIYTERERFILALWSSLFAEGAYKKGKDDELLLQWGVKQVSDYIKSRYELTSNLLEKETKIVNGKEHNLPDRIQVTFSNKTTLTFDPNNLPFLVESIGGKELLLTKDDGLTPYNSTLIAFLKVFASKDALRPAMQGAYFDVERSAVVATDGHRLVLIEGQPTMQGLFSVDGNAKPIDERFPRYYEVIPENNKSRVTLEAKELIRLVTNAIKGLKSNVYKPIKLVRVGANRLKIIAEDLDYSYESIQYTPAQFEGKTMPIIGFNAKLMLENLKAFVKYHGSDNKNPKITFEIEGHNKAVIVNYKSVFGKTILLMMPLQHYNYEDPEEYKQEASGTTPNRALALKVAIAKAKIAIALAVK